MVARLTSLWYGKESAEEGDEVLHGPPHDIVQASVDAGAGGVAVAATAVGGREGSDVAILAFGSMVKRALDAADLLASEGVQARVVDMRWVKPLDADAIRAAAETGYVVTVEDGVIEGGAGEGVLEELSRMGMTPATRVLGIDDQYVHQGKPDLLMHDLGLDAEGVAAAVRELMGR